MNSSCCFPSQVRDENIMTVVVDKTDRNVPELFAQYPKSRTLELI